MPGTLPNSTIKNAIDQVIQAINDLELGGTEGNFSVSIEAEDIVAKLEEIRTLYETESLAAITAQNTNFSDLSSDLSGVALQISNLIYTVNGGLQNVATAIQGIQSSSGGCGCEGSRGAGTWPADPSTQGDTPEDHVGAPPAGFDTWTEYHSYKCDMAYLIINDMITDISVGGILVALYASVAVLAPVLILHMLTPIGWAELIAVAGLFITCWAAGVNISLLSQLLEDDKDGFVCELLNGTSVGDSISNFSNRVDSGVDEAETLGALPDILRSQVKSLIKSYATVDSINRLYVKSPVPPPGGNDCSGCGESVDIILYRGRGTNLQINEGQYSIDSLANVPPPPGGLSRIAFGLAPEGANNPFTIVTFDITGYVPYSAGQTVSIWYEGDPTYTVLPTNCSGSDIETALIGESVVDVDIANANNVSFSVVFTISV